MPPDKMPPCWTRQCMRSNLLAAATRRTTAFRIACMQHLKQLVTDAVQQTVAIVQTADNECVNERLC